MPNLDFNLGNTRIFHPPLSTLTYIASHFSYKHLGPLLFFWSPMLTKTHIFKTNMQSRKYLSEGNSICSTDRVPVGHITEAAGQLSREDTIVSGGLQEAKHKKAQDSLQAQAWILRKK